MRFIADLRLLLKESSAKRQDIIITGDFNDVIGDSFNPLTKLIQQFDLRDVHAFNHGYNYDIATYFRGSCQLDYVFVSRCIIDHVVRCGYEPFKARFSTDHRAYFVDFSIAELFDRRLPVLFSPSQRHISGNHPKNVQKYIIFIFNYIQEHNLLKKARECQHKVYFPQSWRKKSMKSLQLV